MPARPSVAIVTDTTSCLPAALVERYGIELVPLHIIFDGRTFVDSMSDTRDFYALLRASKARPTTAAPTPEMFLQAIARAARRADAVLCITVSAQFSAMYDAARQAIDMARAESPRLDVRLLDSRNAAMAQGFVVLEAARAAARGEPVDVVAATATDMTRRVSLFAMLDTLAYLARSGRVPRAAAWAAGLLDVKPIVRFDDTDVRLVARTRSRARAIERLAALVAGTAAGRPAHVAVHHAGAEEDGQALLAAIERSVRLEESYLTEFTQVMGVHTGPGLVGAALWVE
jgi:DegV family protein with EDD domain